MHCDEFEQRLNLVLDERGDPGLDGPLQSHAMFCQSCAENLHLYQLMLRGLSQSRRQCKPYSLAGVISESTPSAITPSSITSSSAVLTRSLPAATSPPSANWMTWVLSTAAIVACVMVFSWSQPSAQQVANHPSAGLSPFAISQPSLAAVRPGFSTGYEGPAPASSDATQFSAYLLSSSILVSQNWSSESWSSEEWPSEHGPAQHGNTPMFWLGHRIADGYRPVANSMLAAIDLLFRRTTPDPLPANWQRSSTLDASANLELVA
ncbi:MAG: hypothetical protein SGJ20_03650 [Planctomycetota bacterium]|nr:hypothetical protein [Planctomycetota bacterium]